MSDYIDSLNQDKKPIEHDNEIKTSDFNINKHLLNEKDLKKNRKKRFFGLVSAAAVALIIILNMTVNQGKKVVKIDYTSQDKQKKVSILQERASGEFKPASISTLVKINNSIAEIQSPKESEAGVLLGGGAYAGTTDMDSIRRRQDEIEYAVVGNVPLEELSLFIKELTNGNVDLSYGKQQLDFGKPKVEVPVDLAAEEGDQKNVDSGHSPWKLDPVFVTQVFVSLKISPEGIQGDYPIKYEDIRIIQNNGKEAVAEVSGNETPIKRVYLKRIVRQNNTGIWTVVGYDPVEGK